MRFLTDPPKLGLLSRASGFISNFISMKWLVFILIGGLLAMTAWGWRMDSLREKWRTTAYEITWEVAAVAGIDRSKLKPKDAVAKIRGIAEDRDLFRRERDNARGVIDVQSTSIRNYEKETNRMRAISAKQAKLVASLIAQRNVWIQRAKDAGTRTERLTCEEELKETEDVLDALYEAGY